MNANVQWTCNELIRALIEGGAQGGLIVGLTWVCLKLCSRANAATRHGAWFATLLVVAILPAAIFTRSALEQFQPAPIATTALNTPPAESGSDFEEAPLADPNEPEPIIQFAQPSPDPIPSIQEPTPEHRFNWSISLPTKVSMTLVACWLILATIRSGVLAAQLVTLRRIKMSAILAPEILRESFASIVTSMRLSRKPRLLISDKAIAPMVVGFFRPAMLLPNYITARCTSTQLEHLFRHELAHLARRDDWTNLLQQIIAAIFFFHPGVLFVSRRLTAEREIACDDHALAISRAPRDYALFLTEFASQMKGRDFTAAPAAWSSNSQLKERIGMILNGKRNASPRVSRVGVGAISAAAVALALVALAMTPRFVVAAEPPEAPEAPEAPTAVNIEAAIAAAPELAVSAVPAPPAAPVITLTAPQPAGVAIASVGPAREKFDVPSPKINVNVTPGPMKISTVPRIAQAEPAEPRRPKRVDRGDDDMERRLDRLEKMVEELVNREKRKGPGPDRPGWEGNFQYKPQPGLPPDFDKQIQEQIERARRDADRAKRDAERAVREQKMAMEQHMSADRQREWAGQMKLNAEHESLKARKRALEEQRKHIEKELEAIEKDMQKQDEAKKIEKMEKEREKRNKADEKPEKKTRDTDSDDDNRKAK